MWISDIQLQRDFFKAFFCALSMHGHDLIDLNSHDNDNRFDNMHKYMSFELEKLKSKNKHPYDNSSYSSLERLVCLLRPDPITGIMSAVTESVFHLNYGIIKIIDDNKISITKSEELSAYYINSLPKDVKNIFDKLVECWTTTNIHQLM